MASLWAVTISKQLLPVALLLVVNIVSKNFCDQLRCFADYLFTKNIAVMLMHKDSKLTSNVVSIVSRDLHFSFLRNIPLQNF